MWTSSAAAAADAAPPTSVLLPRAGWDLLEQHVILPATAEALRLLRPLALRCDVLMCTALCYAAPLAAELAGVPWASALFTPITFFSARDPSALQALPWLPVLCGPLPLRLRRPLLGALRGAACARATAHLDALRHAHGLPRAPSGAAHATLSPHASLMLSPAALFPRQCDWPHSAAQCGAVSYDAAAPPHAPPDGDAHGAAAAQEALRAFLHDAPLGAPRPVVFALGSCIGHLGAAVSLVRLFADAVALLPPGARAIIVTGPVAWPLLAAQLNDTTQDDSTLAAALAAERTGGAAAAAAAAAAAPRPRLVAVPWAPYGTLFAHAAAVVHQGGACPLARTRVSSHLFTHSAPTLSHTAGAGTAAKAMRAGVPTVMYPHLFDTHDTARRAAAAGASLTLPLSRLSAPALAAALRRVLEERTFGDAAARLQGIMLAEGACLRAAQRTCAHTQMNARDRCCTVSSLSCLIPARRAPGDGAVRAAEEIVRLVARSRQPGYVPTGVQPPPDADSARRRASAWWGLAPAGAEEDADAEGGDAARGGAKARGAVRGAWRISTVLAALAAVAAGALLSAVVAPRSSTNSHHWQQQQQQQQQQ
jgi:hypothetical protein